MADTLSLWFFYFMIYSFLGWACETVYCSIPAKHFINRGFLNGPFCPIYGCGALFIVAVLEPYVNNVFLVFILGMIFTSVLEYVTSFLMEKLFHCKWWDYSDKPLNLNGRICLKNSLLFGVMSVVVMFFVHPWIRNMVSALSPLTREIISAALLIYFAFDLVLTVRSVLKLNSRLKKLRQLKQELLEAVHQKELEREATFNELLEQLKTASSQKLASFQARAQTLRDDNRLLQRRLLKAFPNLKTPRYSEQLEAIKAALRNKKK